MDASGLASEVPAVLGVSSTCRSGRTQYSITCCDYSTFRTTFKLGSVPSMCTSPSLLWDRGYNMFACRKTQQGRVGVSEAGDQELSKFFSRPIRLSCPNEVDVLLLQYIYRTPYCISNRSLLQRDIDYLALEQVLLARRPRALIHTLTLAYPRAQL